MVKRPTTRTIFLWRRSEDDDGDEQPRTQTSLSRWKCARKGRREGDNGRNVVRLPSVPIPWPLAVHNKSLAFRARLYDAKNEAPEEVAWFLDVRVRSRSRSFLSGGKGKERERDRERPRTSDNQATEEEAGLRGRQKSVCTCGILCHIFVVTAQLWRENVLFYVLWRRFWIWKWLLRIHLQKNSNELEKKVNKCRLE